jgi:hypothetical protein
MAQTQAISFINSTSGHVATQKMLFAKFITYCHLALRETRGLNFKHLNYKLNLKKKKRNWIDFN